MNLDWHVGILFRYFWVVVCLDVDAVVIVLVLVVVSVARGIEWACTGRSLCGNIMIRFIITTLVEISDDTPDSFRKEVVLGGD